MSADGSRGRAPRACVECGAELIGKPRHQKFCTPQCAHTNLGRKQRGEEHPTFKGRVKHHGGYYRVFKPGHPLAHADGYVLEHRLVLFDAGVEIPPKHHVHHLNHDKRDNRLENLAVLSASEHHRHHLQVGAEIINQYGAFKVLTVEDRAARKRERMAAWRAANQGHIRAYKARRRDAGLPY